MTLHYLKLLQEADRINIVYYLICHGMEAQRGSNNVLKLPVLIPIESNFLKCQIMFFPETRQSSSLKIST